MTLQLAALLALSAVCGVSVSALYIVWPRRMTAEEWVLHRRAVSVPTDGRRPSAIRPRFNLGPLGSRLERYSRLLALTKPDLDLLRLAGGREPGSDRELAYAVARLVGYGVLIALAVDLVFWFASGRSGAWAPFGLVAVIVAAVLVPALWLLSVRRRALYLRAAIDRRLPRLLTAARVLLESGATTPEGAVNEAVALHADTAADLLREALRLKEVQRLDLEVALDDVAHRYEVQSVERLADGFRVGSRYGTRMAQLLAEHALQLRQRQHQDYRERVTRAPVLMTVPALLFFVLPLLVLIMYLVFTPLLHTLTQL